MSIRIIFIAPFIKRLKNISSIYRRIKNLSHFICIITNLESIFFAPSLSATYYYFSMMPISSIITSIIELWTMLICIAEHLITISFGFRMSYLAGTCANKHSLDVSIQSQQRARSIPGAVNEETLEHPQPSVAPAQALRLASAQSYASAGKSLSINMSHEEMGVLNVELREAVVQNRPKRLEVRPVLLLL
jgi:hypothetical protein